MRDALFGETGAPSTCPGRTYGRYEIDDIPPDERRRLTETFELQQTVTSDEDQALCQSESRPFKITNLEIPKIKTWLHDSTLGYTAQNTPHPLKMLQHMLQRVQELHSDRYGDYLKSHTQDEVIASMVSLLRPEAWEVLCSIRYAREKWSFIHLINIEGDPGEKGIYLHILWHKHQPTRYYLYVGQSVRLLERLANHRDLKYRAKQPSLHYYVWDLGVVDEELETEEKFVFLANVEGDVHLLGLNLVEMWCSLVLQTLTRNALQAYLPNGALSIHAGGHLNVALPLHKSMQNEIIRDRLSLDIYHSHDPSIQAYYASLRQNFYNLKSSPNPVLRELYKTRMYEAQLTRADTCRRKSAQALIAGTQVNIKCNQWRQRFSLSHWIFSVSRKDAHLDDGATFHVECSLRPDRHSNCYATKSHACDLGARLGIRLTGIDTNDKPVETWLASSGTLLVFKMNTFVDMLQGLDIHDPKDRQRRWIPSARATRKKATYTADVIPLLDEELTK